MIDPRVTWRAIRQHPLAREHAARVIWNILSWQCRSRLTRQLDIPFVDATVLRASRALTGLSGNIYFGLHEYESMSFALHLLGSEDRFVDAGANAGSYTVLAAGVRGAQVLAIEPDPDARQALRDNLAANHIESQVELSTMLIAGCAGELAFSRGLDTTNHVLSETELRAGLAHDLRPASTLDQIVAGRTPALIKIDIEGAEMAALDGATQTLGAPGLLALIIECSEHSEAVIRTRLRANGFEAVRYHPRQRHLERREDGGGGNTLYVRWSEALLQRLRQARPVRIHPLSCLL